METLPVIDVSPLTGVDEQARRRVILDVGDACHETGFLVIRGHGIPRQTISRLRDLVTRFFDYPLEEKLALSITPDNYRGYIPLGFFTPNSTGDTPDQYEGYKLHLETDRLDPIRNDCDLYGPNRWPDRPAGFRDAVLDYWRHCDRVAGYLLEALACVLGIGAEFFQRAFDKPLTNMTLLHYPPQASGGAFGIHPHKDTDALTILAPDSAGGLFVRCTGSDRWLSADAPDDSLIVNIGDMLEIWSGGYFVSTPHKVENSSGRERYSFPYFAVPRFDVTVSPLLAPQPGFEHREIDVGAASREVWQSNWPDAAAIDARIDPATP